jgi:hypothetical protein
VTRGSGTVDQPRVFVSLRRGPNNETKSAESVYDVKKGPVNYAERFSAYLSGTASEQKFVPLPGFTPKPVLFKSLHLTIFRRAELHSYSIPTFLQF